MKLAFDACMYTVVRCAGEGQPAEERNILERATMLLLPRQDCGEVAGFEIASASSHITLVCLASLIYSLRIPGIFSLLFLARRHQNGKQSYQIKYQVLFRLSFM